MNNSFTPGPWIVDEGRSGFKTDIYSVERAVTLATTEIIGFPKKEMEANARLIAKAPTMFKLLKELYNQFDPVEMASLHSKTQYGFVN